MNILALSDTHWHNKIYAKLQPADMLVIAGDYHNGSLPDLLTFKNSISKIAKNYKDIIIIPGNHNVYEFGLDPKLVQSFFPDNVHYLVDDYYKTSDNIIIYGTPWSPMFNDWAYMLSEEELKHKFNNIPSDVDILVTHTPPYGILDTVNDMHVGSKALEEAVLKCKPKIHIFGHLHDGHGVEHSKYTSFYNVSVLNDDYKITYEPTIINI